eukprot:5172141-Amphidinium_carterae.1
MEVTTIHKYPSMLTTSLTMRKSRYNNTENVATTTDVISKSKLKAITDDACEFNRTRNLGLSTIVRNVYHAKVQQTPTAHFSTTCYTTVHGQHGYSTNSCDTATTTLMTTMTTSSEAYLKVTIGHYLHTTTAAFEAACLRTTAQPLQKLAYVWHVDHARHCQRAFVT